MKIQQFTKPNVMEKYKPKKKDKIVLEHLNKSKSSNERKRTIEWEIPEYYVNFSFKAMLQKMLAVVFKVLMILKYLLVQQYKKIFGDLSIPWFKLSFLAILAFVMLKKDFQFNLAFKSPLAMMTGSSDNADNDNGIDAKTVSWKGNLAAPVSDKDLKSGMTQDFIKKYSELAVTEMKEYGIPASIKMAQALIESRAGTSTLAVNNNNHFGMKCFSKNCKKGHCTNLTDDHHKDFFRTYKNSWESWRAHSQLISQGRYRKLKYNGRNYKEWAKGLKAAGYATDKRYAEKLIGIIEKYNLNKLDEL